MSKTTHKFQAEVEQILDLMVHSLYSQKEIFLRELISNSSDAIEKRRLEGLKDEKLRSDDEGHIRLSFDKDKKTLTIKDNGIGMTAEEVNKNIGTIAHSGTKAFFENAKKLKENPELIGQFGVGFYSAFMVADKVEIITQSHQNTPTAHWTCDGSPQYTLEEADKRERGTEIILHIAKDSKGKVDVTLIEASKRYYTCFFSNLYLGDFRNYGSIGHNYYGLAVNRGVNVVHEWATSVDTASKQVKLGSGGSI